MSMDVAAARRLRGVVDDLLDRRYDRAAASVLRAVASITSGGVMRQRLAELDAEAARLADAGERLRPDNPVLRALLSDLESTMQRARGMVDAAAVDVQSAGVDVAQSTTMQMAFPGMDAEMLARLGVEWNVPDPDAVRRYVGYVESDAWAEMMRRYPDDVLGIVNNQAVAGFAQGWGPRRIAREIRRTTTQIPAHQANTLMRTLQMESYRSATSAQAVANNDVVNGQIRIAALDERTCLACVALHGTIMPLGSKVTDHYNGRCTSILTVRGRNYNIQSGEAWWNTLDDGTKIRMAGPAKHEAIRDGELSLRDFVHPHTDATFGEMVREGSLRGVRARLEAERREWTHWDGSPGGGAGRR